jgi:hypothetical protein
VSQKRHQVQFEEIAEQISVARLEQLRTNYETAREAGRWHKPMMTDEQRQTAAQLLAELALLDKQEKTLEGER